MAGTRVTLGDVARTAGVSVSTASEALSGRGRMTERTRASVKEAARTLGYRANSLARGLRTGRTGAIGLHHLHIADRFDSEYFREFVAGAMETVSRHDYDLSLLSVDPTRPRSVMPHVDGVIVADAIADDVRAAELLASGLPVVAGEVYPPGMDTSPVIAIDHLRGLTALLDHGREQGAVRPLLFTRDRRSGWGVALGEAYTSWCREHGIEPRQHVSGFKEPFGPAQREALVSDLTGPDPSDLVVVPGEHDAYAVLEVLTALGRRVPDDVLLATCSDARLLEVSDPQVSAIGLRPRHLGAACADALLRHLDRGEPIAELTLLEPELNLRTSTTGRP